MPSGVSTRLPRKVTRSCTAVVVKAFGAGASHGSPSMPVTPLLYEGSTACGSAGAFWNQGRRFGTPQLLIGCRATEGPAGIPAKNVARSCGVALLNSDPLGMSGNAPLANRLNLIVQAEPVAGNNRSEQSRGQHLGDRANVKHRVAK